MKWKYSIGILAFALLMVVAYYGSYQYTLNKLKASDETQEETQTLPITSVDAGNADKITGKTIYTLQTYNSTTDELTEEDLTIPVEFLGLGREELVEYLLAYAPDDSETSEDLTFIDFSLVSFSAENIILRKTYTMDYMFYLAEEDGHITVYYKDKTSVFEHTDIVVSNLPETIREEIIKGKYIKNNAELFSFLENYSS